MRSVSSELSFPPKKRTKAEGEKDILRKEVIRVMCGVWIRTALSPLNQTSKNLEAVADGALACRGHSSLNLVSCFKILQNISMKPVSLHVFLYDHSSTQFSNPSTDMTTVFIHTMNTHTLLLLLQFLPFFFKLLTTSSPPHIQMSSNSAQFKATHANREIATV